jgi:hypothetical protein
MADADNVLGRKNNDGSNEVTNLPIISPSLTNSLRAFSEINSTYDNVVSRLAEINNDYSIAATKAISLYDQYFPKTLLDSFNKASQAYTSIFAKVDSLLPAFDKVAAISPFMESARNANIAIQSISESYLPEGLLKLYTAT